MTEFSVLRYNPQQLAALRSVLKAAGYVPEGIAQTIGSADGTVIRESDALLLMHHTAAGSQLDTLIRLFLIEEPVDVAHLATAIAPMTPDEWEKMGIIVVRKSRAVAKVRLLPYESIVLAYDQPSRLLTEDGFDYVMGVGGSSTTLANLTIREPCASALDLGTGCGFQAFLAAKHCQTVVAVDRNPRAIAFATLNAELNGLSEIECREGDLFEPVAGMTFDLIVSNPPFVISPASRYIYRDNGLAGDEVCQKIVLEVPGHLNEEGFCQILCNWAEYAETDWKERFKGWFEQTGCDVLVMRNSSKDVATYAVEWLRHTEKLETDNLSALFEEWMAYYRKQGIERVGEGIINMRRRSGGSNWFRADDDVKTIRGPGGEYVARVFAAQDFLEGVRDNEALLGIFFAVSPDLRLLIQNKPSPDGWAVEKLEVNLARGLSQTGKIDPYVEKLLMQCDGSRPLRDLAGDMASVLGVEANRIEPTVCSMVRDFVGRGFILPPGHADTIT
jgi:SAM-dependent methyltransferase